MNNLVKVPFHEGEILCMGEYVVLKPLCEQLGLDPRGQQQRIQRAAWGRKGACIMHAPSAGGEQLAFMLHRKRIAMWLATVDTDRVREELRPYLEQLQEECADVLDTYFMGGAAQPQSDLSRRVERLEAQMALLTRTGAGARRLPPPRQPDAELLAQVRAYLDAQPPGAPVRIADFIDTQHHQPTPTRRGYEVRLGRALRSLGYDRRRQARTIAGLRAYFYFAGGSL